MNAAHLTAAKATDLDTPRGRFFYRMFEILPGAIAWSTLLLAFLVSWLFPALAAFFILGFVLYWFLRTVYFAFHLRAGYRRTREHEKANWLQRVKKIEGWEGIYHLVLVPTYREPLEILRETFAALRSSDYPKDKMMVVLGIEEREGEEGARKARALEREFGGDFLRFLISWHPAGLLGEIAGKGANETWAAKKAKAELIDPLGILLERVIVTSLDADTVVFPKYFSCLAHHYLTSLAPLRHSYQPVPLFINNIWTSSALSRLFAFATTFWFLMNQERPEKLSTFSSHSMAFKTLVEVGYRQVNYAVDDSRIFWQCFLRYEGDYSGQPLYYPLSMDAKGGVKSL